MKEKIEHEGFYDERGKIMEINESLLVGVDFTNDEDTCILIVGRKRPDHSVDIVNAFQGKEAEELYKKLIGKKGVLEV